MDRRNGAKVLVDVLDRSLFGDREDIYLFPRLGQLALAKGHDGIHDIHLWVGPKGLRSPLRAIRGYCRVLVPWLG